MTITTPIYFVTIKGDYKEQASKRDKTIIATYEPHIDSTYIVSEADVIDISDYVIDYYKAMSKSIKKVDMTIIHSLDGINFISVNTN